jgi:hypothetical protein
MKEEGKKANGLDFSMLSSYFMSWKRLMIFGLLHELNLPKTRLERSQ